MMKRREFITLLGGAAAAPALWPLAARAQQGERMRRIAVLAGGAGDEDRQERNTAFVQALQNLGWTVGRNVSFRPRRDTSYPRSIPDGSTLLTAA